MRRSRRCWVTNTRNGRNTKDLLQARQQVNQLQNTLAASGNKLSDDAGQAADCGAVRRAESASPRTLATTGATGRADLAAGATDAGAAAYSRQQPADGRGGGPPHDRETQLDAYKAMLEPTGRRPARHAGCWRQGWCRAGSLDTLLRIRLRCSPCSSPAPPPTPARAPDQLGECVGGLNNSPNRSRQHQPRATRRCHPLLYIRPDNFHVLRQHRLQRLEVTAAICRTPKQLQFGGPGAQGRKMPRLRWRYLAARAFPDRAHAGSPLRVAVRQRPRAARPPAPSTAYPPRQR